MIKLTKTKQKFSCDKKSIKLKGYNYFLDIYGVNIVLILGDKNINKYYKLNNVKDKRKGFILDYFVFDSTFIIFLNSKMLMNIIVHEATHCSNFIMNHIGYPYTLKGDEVNAYLVAHLVDVILKSKKKHNKKQLKGSYNLYPF